MWVASVYGYFSIVKKKQGYFVRARAKKDLESLLKATGLTNEILKIPNTDYLVRIIVDKDQLAIIQQVLFDSIDYDNFKNKIKTVPTQKDKVSYYTDIWWVMFDYQNKKV